MGVAPRQAIQGARRRGQWRLHALNRHRSVEHGHGPLAHLSGAPDQVIAHLGIAGVGAAECDLAIDEALGIEAVEPHERVLDQVHVGLTVVWVELQSPFERGPVRFGRTQEDAPAMEVALAQTDPRLDIVRVRGSQRLQRLDVERRDCPDLPRVAVREPIREVQGSRVGVLRDIA